MTDTAPTTLRPVDQFDDPTSEVAALLAEAMADDVALNLPDDLPWAHWTAIGQHLQHIARGASWWVGDWLRFGEHRWGEKYAQAISVTGLGSDTLVGYQWVASRFVPEDRRPELSWTHHRIAAGLDHEFDRNAVLAKAVDEGWTTRELEAEVKRRRSIDADSDEVDAPVNPEDPVTRVTFKIAVTVPAHQAGAAEAVAEEMEGVWREHLADAGVDEVKVESSSTRKAKS